MALFCLISCTSEAKTIIWDLGGVLFAPNKLKITLWELGLPTLMGHTLIDGKNPKNLQERAFEVLNLLGTQQGPEELRLKSPEGLELPQLFVDMLCGIITPQEALKQSTDLVNQLWQEKFITKRREMELLLSIMRTMFDSETFIQYIKAIPGGAQLVATCAQDPELNQFVLSNWDAHSFNLLYDTREGQKIFAHIKPENIMISGACHLAKPDPAIFKNLIATHNLDPRDCVFIDDNLENVHSAVNCGFNAIWFHNMSYKDLKKLLVEHGFLNSPSKHSTNTQNTATV